MHSDVSVHHLELLHTGARISFDRSLHNALTLQVSPLILQVNLTSTLEDITCLIQNLLPLALAKLQMAQDLIKDQ